MKKLLFMFATAALVLSACSSEDDIVQGGGSLPQLGASKAVAFDTYTSAATKAGDAGVMTTDKLKSGSGFGVFAMYQDGINYPVPNNTLAPNFMFNEHVSWSGGWTYSPLKYWPNETTKDSQVPAATSDQTDKLSFFAYAPYVDLSAAPGTMTTNRGASTTVEAYIGSPVQTAGIISYTKETVTGDPLVEWGYSADLDQNVDLLWGVAPAGMSYQDVTGGTTTATLGLPLLNMVKPDKDQKMKFLFQHALSRIGLSVVSAIDQIAAGDDGNKFNNMQTRVLIKSVEVYGDFVKQGVLNLNNTTPNVANWITTSFVQHAVDGAALFTFDSRSDGSTGNGYIAPDLRYVNSQITGVTSAVDKAAAATAFAALNTGVLPSEQTLLSGDADPSKKVTNPAFEYGKVYYKALTDPDKGYVIATTEASEACDAYVKVGDDYQQVFKTVASSKAPLNGNSAQLYKLTEGSQLAEGATLADATKYFKKTGSDGNWVYTEVTGDGSTTVAAGEIFFTEAAGANALTSAELAGDAYTAGDYYTALIPRYFMVIPNGNTNIKVKITYAVVTYDEKLNSYVTNVQNAITKATTINLQNGKSYNLKLILGLTSVKLDATVADWLVADDSEIWLPRNNE